MNQSEREAEHSKVELDNTQKQLKQLLENMDAVKSKTALCLVHSSSQEMFLSELNLK